VKITLLLDIAHGRAAAPMCEAAIPRECKVCGALAVLPLDAETRAKQPDGTTLVCHPVLGGCNLGYEVVT
jgi:hypothetical protein